ncbi:glycosyltransferase [Puniceicoccaceae bacterium K14]|nr:glycosyltransferase [Puniceicoccaceae bacterium K14]
MVIVITTHGSTGDIYPLIGLSRELLNAGHEVRFATSKPFKNDVESAGVPFYQIPPNWDKTELADWMGRLQHLKSPVRQLQELYKAASPHLEAIIEEMGKVLQGADCVISSYLFPINKAIADKHSLPYISYAFAHNSVPSRYYAPHGLPRLRGFPDWIQMRWNILTWKIANFAVDAAVNKTILRHLKRKGLPPIKDFFSKPAELVLVAVSPKLMRPKIELNPRFQFTGYCRWQSPRSQEAEEKIKAFRGDSLVPVISFGSMVYDKPDEVIDRLIKNWPKERKLIIQTGWSGFTVPGSASHILQVDPMSHDQLFAHASVVIHHGGAGTTASVLHAGKPHIVVPHIGDQDFFSAEVVRIGCGIKCRKTTWPEKLLSKVEKIESNPKYTTNARKQLEILKTENGPKEAVHQIELYLKWKKSQIGEPLRDLEDF